MATRTKTVPKATDPEVAVPEGNIIEKELPSSEIKQTELPEIGTPENTVTIGGKLIEIKPMKLKYVRNRTAAFRHILEMYPLSDILAMDQKFGDGRDGDKALMDWLIAVTDNEELIRSNYNDIDTATIYKMLQIHRRIEKVDEMEAKLKNVKTPGEA
jgi:hypothetical protein